MTIDLKVYDNGDHTCLVWLPANGQAIPDCRGFAIHRTRKQAAGGPSQDTVYPRVCRIFRRRTARSERALETPCAALHVVGLPGRPRRRGAVFDHPSRWTRQGPSEAVTSRRQRPDAADDDYGPSVGAYLRLFQQGHRLGAMGDACARKRRHGRQARYSHRAKRQLAAQCVERSLAPAIARYAQRRQKERRRDLRRAL